MSSQRPLQEVKAEGTSSCPQRTAKKDMYG